MLDRSPSRSEVGESPRSVEGWRVHSALRTYIFCFRMAKDWPRIDNIDFSINCLYFAAIQRLKSVAKYGQYDKIK